jgi:hypothetical protein
MGGAEDLAGAAVRALSKPGVSVRKWAVVGVNAGPPKSLNLAQTVGGVAVVTGVRASATYWTLVPAVGDAVYVQVTRSGGSGRLGGRVRGGDVFVVDKVAV